MLGLHGKAYNHIFDLQEKYITINLYNNSRVYIYDSESVDQVQHLGIDLGMVETLRNYVREFSGAQQCRAAVDTICYNTLSSEPAFISFAEGSRVDDGYVFVQDVCTPEIAAIL